MYITVRMQKTQQLVNNPVSEEALELIGFYDGEHEPDAKVFPDFKEKMTGTTLKNSLKAAGITKHITFHCARHTFGSLQVDAGTVSTPSSTCSDTKMWKPLKSMRTWLTRASVRVSTASR